VAGAFGDTTCLVEGLEGDIELAEGNFGLDLGHGSEGRSLAAKDHGKDSGLALDDSLIVNVERVRNHFLGVRCLRSRQAGRQRSCCRTTLLQRLKVRRLEEAHNQSHLMVKGAS
jgi:hypothetical protein